MFQNGNVLTASEAHSKLWCLRSSIKRCKTKEISISRKQCCMMFCLVLVLRRFPFSHYVSKRKCLNCLGSSFKTFEAYAVASNVEKRKIPIPRKRYRMMFASFSFFDDFRFLTTLRNGNVLTVSETHLKLWCVRSSIKRWRTKKILFDQNRYDVEKIIPGVVVKCFELGIAFKPF